MRRDDVDLDLDDGPTERDLQGLKDVLRADVYKNGELSLLLGVGGDTIGDVRVVPGGRSPERVAARLNVSSFEDVRFADLLRSIGVRVDRVGLPGVQDKVSAAMLNVPSSRR